MRSPLSTLAPALVALVLLFSPNAADAECYGLLDVDTGVPCGDVPASGCCGDASTVWYCNGTTICQQPCILTSCGWDDSWGFYDCVLFGEADPSGLHPYTCPGTDGGTDTGEPCGDVTYDGCCDGQTLYYCSNGDLKFIDCSSNSAAESQLCGWVSDDVGYDCTSTSAEGTLPRTCGGGCTPDCHGRQCGADGCGGSCGSCVAPQTCDTATGHCESPCVPDCAGRVCGNDGCGGSCGSCPAGQYCNTAENACVDSCVPSCAGRQCGDNGCDGSCGVCEAGYQCVSHFCVPEACEPNCTGRVCGDDGCDGSCGACAAGESCSDGVCVGCLPDCRGKTCGPDGCGGSCGECVGGQICDPQYFLCVADMSCTSNCADRECGSDGCGGMCGSCAVGVGLQCYEGHCVDCVPQCEDRHCGDDGCGDVCGVCEDGNICDASGLCVEPAPDAGDGNDEADSASQIPMDGPDVIGADKAGGDPGTSCPPGSERRYGLCVPVSSEMNPPGAAASSGPRMASGLGSCAVGGAPAPLPFALILLLSLLLGLPLALTRRTHPRA